MDPVCHHNLKRFASAVHPVYYSLYLYKRKRLQGDKYRSQGLELNEMTGYCSLAIDNIVQIFLDFRLLLNKSIQSDRF